MAFVDPEDVAIHVYKTQNTNSLEYKCTDREISFVPHHGPFAYRLRNYDLKTQQAPTTG